MFTLLPLLWLLVVLAVFVKLAARLYRKSRLRWPHAFAFAALAVVVKAAGAALPFGVSAVLGIGIQIALGGWFLGPRALAPSGAPVAFKGGAAIAALAVAFATVFSFIAGVLLLGLIH